MGIGADSRVALVTGASSGIGQETARLLADQGFTVAACARRQDRLMEMADARIRPYVCDVTDAGGVQDVVGRVVEELGRIDAVVNCAGGVFSAPLESADDGQIRGLFEQNFFGTINVIRAAIPALKQSKGSIVNVSSTLINRPVPGVSIYSATKGALEALSNTLALELGADGIRVNVVRPSLVRTEIWPAGGMPEAQFEAMITAVGKKYPVGRPGEPKDLAELIAFLVSERAGWITGTVMTIDGGHSIGAVER